MTSLHFYHGGSYLDPSPPVHRSIYSEHYRERQTPSKIAKKNLDQFMISPESREAFQKYLLEFKEKDEATLSEPISPETNVKTTPKTLDNYQITQKTVDIARTNRGVYHWDEGNRSYFVIDQGICPSSGYKLELEGIEGNHIKVKVTRPPYGKPQLTVVTHPAFAISLPKGEYQIDLVDESGNPLPDNAFPFSNSKPDPGSPFNHNIGGKMALKIIDPKDIKTEPVPPDSYEINKGTINIAPGRKGIYHWDDHNRSYYVIDQGQCNSTGYGLELVSVEGNHIKIKVVQPGKGEFVGMALTHPAIALSLPKGDYQIDLVDRDGNPLPKDSFPFSNFKPDPDSHHNVGKSMPLITLNPEKDAGPETWPLKFHHLPIFFPPEDHPGIHHPRDSHRGFDPHRDHHSGFNPHRDHRDQHQRIHLPEIHPPRIHPIKIKPGINPIQERIFKPDELKIVYFHQSVTYSNTTHITQDSEE